MSKSSLIALSLIVAVAEAQTPGYVAVNFDDLPVVCKCKDNADRMVITDKLLATFKEHRIPVMGVVNEQKLESDGVLDPERIALLRKWLEGGFELGNHGYSHKNLNEIPMEDYKKEIIGGDRVTRPLAVQAGLPYRYYRHPFGTTGDNLQIRAGLNAFLKEHGYVVAPNTITYQDYVFAGAYERAFEKGDTARMRKIRAAYLPYTLSHWQGAENQTRELLGRDIKHILVVHANRLNADAFGEVIAMMKKRGYVFITTEEAMSDPAYARPDTFDGPIGVTWLSRWASEMGKPRFFKAEPVPQFVLEE